MTCARIKICGIRRVEDALAAAQAGADAIGMVFHPHAPRNVTPGDAGEILAALPPFVTPVGLFVDASVETVKGVAGELGLRHLQLHGRESAEYVRALQQFVVLKAIRVAQETFAAELQRWRLEMAGGGLANLRGFVLETAAAAPGGTGVANDWDYIRHCRSRGMFDGLPPLIAAGGLTPGTVGAVVRSLRPWAVDVSSGVEISRGVKSAERIEAFIKAVWQADESPED